MRLCVWAGVPGVLQQCDDAAVTEQASAQPARRRRRSGYYISLAYAAGDARDRSNIRSTVVLLAKTGYLGPKQAAFVLRDIRNCSGTIALPIGAQSRFKTVQLLPGHTYEMEW